MRKKNIKCCFSQEQPGPTLFCGVMSVQYFEPRCKCLALVWSRTCLIPFGCHTPSSNKGFISGLSSDELHDKTFATLSLTHELISIHTQSSLVDHKLLLPINRSPGCVVSAFKSCLPVTTKH